MSAPGLARSMSSSALRLLLFAALGTALLAGVYQLTRDRITLQEERVVLQSLNQIIPPDRYDNELATDHILLREPGHFQHPDPVVVWRARRGGQPVGVIMQLTTADGYNGDIGLLVGIGSDGEILGVRVTRHRETPGLGDGIELRRDPWILAFDGRSLDNTPAGDWDVRRHGGDFDQFTGATITPRAVVRAVRRALTWYRGHSQELYRLPSQSLEGQAVGQDREQAGAEPGGDG